MPVEEFLDESLPNPPGYVGIEEELETAGVEYGKVDFDSVPNSPKREEKCIADL